ncbi:multiple inositol polyphosphate phosphatase 1-like [Daktulosphaira vitifoliae]|uniref:multiple inositol polyphosphate phosphatase 1-like n=1 Tax=Daktulosphaira vitifoliae TaxID=58002 RepID=UPI0021AA5D74|nr:multiple inositol polyphosphate phosphatase 1-like [Daktulosphaira vitifoliae]
MMFSIRTVLLLVTLTKGEPDILCYQTTKYPPQTLFGSISPYPLDSIESIQIPEKCQTAQLWLLSRHGTRHPSASIISKISSLLKYNISKTNMCEEDKIAINNWKPTNLTEEDAHELNDQGILDMYRFGKRIRKTFIELFNKSYDYQVLSSPKSRCLYSAKHFINGLFNTTVIKDFDDIPIRKPNDTRLDLTIGRSLKHDNYTDWSSQVNQFKNSFNIREVIRNVIQKIKNDDKENEYLVIDDILTMLDSCKYEKTWHLETRPAWCAVFSQNDLQTLEYLDDLKRYYNNAYGNQDNEWLGCPLVKDMITSFKKKIERSEGPKGVFYFGHSSNLLSLITRLGLFNDTEPITADNFDKMKNRKFRASFIDTFASNLMVALYKCEDGDYKVSFYINEKPVKFGDEEGCYDCPWKKIENQFNSIISDKKCLFENEQSSSSNICYKSLYLLFLCIYVTVMNRFND